MRVAQGEMLLGPSDSQLLTMGDCGTQAGNLVKDHFSSDLTKLYKKCYWFFYKMFIWAISGGFEAQGVLEL
jgi:hypothetical protein